MKEDLQDLLKTALAKTADDLEKTLPSVDKINIDHCKNPEHGDFATNLALTLAKALQMAPRDLANSIVENLPKNPLIESTSIAGPGFINFFVSQQSQMTVVKKILENPEAYGRGEEKNHKVQVEFVSANPTGPLHVGHGRGAAIGDSICRILEADGYSVTKEFYYNDAGQQIDNLARSVQLRCQGVNPESDEWPEDGYRGDYILELANSYLNKDTISNIADSDPVTALGDADDSNAIREFAVAYLRREQDLDLQAFDVEFDVFSLESALYADGTVERTVNTLIESGHTFEQDGALWLRATAFGDDKDRVMRKNTGGYTYFVPDVAYHHKKWQRGFTTVINEQGSDHHGTIARVRAGLQALDVGIPADWPAYVLHQMVMVTKGGEEVKISKRAGSYVTLRDLIDQVGKDATRYFLCSRRADSQLTFDIDLALERSNENPVFYIQYAHARICSALENAKQRFDSHSPEQGLTNLELLDGDEELTLARQLARYPEVLQLASRERAPYVIANYLKELAADLHGWYASGNQDKDKQLLVENDSIRDARLCLASAAKIVLSKGMQLLGVSAPSRM